MRDLLTLAPQFQVEWYQWGIAFLAAFILGLSKSGLKGVAIIIITLLALVFGGKASTGILLPILCVGDILAVIYYNRHTQRKYLVQFLPWMMLGVLLGVWIGKDLPEVFFQRIMVVIILVSLGLMFWWEGKENRKVPTHWGFGGVMGLLAGFTTMIGNLAGAFANIFFLAMQLPKNQFIGTAAWLFFIINLFKMPFHIFVWETVSIESLGVSFRLVLITVFGFVVGVRIISLIKNATFRKMILVLTSIGAVLILLRSFGVF